MVGSFVVVVYLSRFSKVQDGGPGDQEPRQKKSNEDKVGKIVEFTTT